MYQKVNKLSIFNLAEIPVPIDYPPLFLNARMMSSRHSKKAMHPVKNDTQVYYFRSKKKEEKVKYSVHLFQSKVIRPLK